MKRIKFQHEHQKKANEEVSTSNLPFLGINFSLKMSSTAGTRNAKVFPEPVRAEPTISRPSRREGMERAWISVILEKPISAIAFRVCSQTCPSKEENALSLETSRAQLDPGTETRIRTYIVQYTENSYKDMLIETISSVLSTNGEIKNKIYLIYLKQNQNVRARDNYRTKSKKSLAKLRC